MGERILVLMGIGDIRQAIVIDCRSVTLRTAQQRSRISLEFDYVIANHECGEVALAVETEQTLFLWCDGSPRDDVIVADGQIVVRLVNPHHPASEITNQVVAKYGRSLGSSFSKSGD